MVQHGRDLDACVWATKIIADSDWLHHHIHVYSDTVRLDRLVGTMFAANCFNITFDCSI